MYLQSRRENRAAKAKKDAEQPSKLDDKSVLADVILQTIPREAQMTTPIGSPMMNGYRKDAAMSNKDVPDTDKKDNGVVNPAFENDEVKHVDFERKNNEINSSISGKKEIKSGVDNATFDKEI